MRKFSFHILVEPISLYGCRVWGTSLSREKKLEVSDRRMRGEGTNPLPYTFGFPGNVMEAVSPVGLDGSPVDLNYKHFISSVFSCPSNLSCSSLS